jgi:hypothetical protein
VLVEATTDSWEFWYGLLIGYISEHETATISAGLVLTDGYKLGKWCDTQRQLFKAQKLSKPRYEKLQALVEYGWAWSINDAFWIENYELLKQYVTKQSLSELTHKTEITKGGVTYKIGEWASNQRKRYKNKKMEDDKARLLEELEGWVWDAKEAVWLEHYEELLRLGVDFPRGRLPINFIDRTGFKLGVWARDQRKIKDKLSPKRRNFLNEIVGFWDDYDEWLIRYNEFVAFEKANGTVVVPRTFTTKGKKGLLIDWLRRQREDKLNLSDEQVKLLEQVPGWRWPIVLGGG